jgi:hypothetical protein
MAATATDTDLATFVLEHESTIVNALQVHARRMREAAAESPGGYGTVFTEEATTTESITRQLTELIERRSAA